MSIPSEITTLASLNFIPYLDENGEISPEFQNKIGVYAIFNQDKELQFVGYSRDIYLSLKQHLVRQSQQCYWLKIQTIARPSRSILEEIRQVWIKENGSIPVGNAQDEAIWSQPIDAKTAMTEAEKEEYAQGGDLEKIKVLKKVARRVEGEIQEQLKERGVSMEIRFSPKLKEEGLLDLKP
jgi:hypothetical protein